MSVQQVIKKYENKRKHSDKHRQILKQQLEKNLQELTVSSLKLHNHKVNQIHKNQQAIESKLRKQQELMQEFRKNEAAWIEMYQTLNRGLREAGNLVHYAGYVEAEIGQLIGQDSVEEYLRKADAEEKVQHTQEQSQAGQSKLAEETSEEKKQQVGQAKQAIEEERARKEVPKAEQTAPIRDDRK